MPDGIRRVCLLRTGAHPEMKVLDKSCNGRGIANGLGRGQRYVNGDGDFLLQAASFHVY
jgi:hypothetical protein